MSNEKRKQRSVYISDEVWRDVRRASIDGGVSTSDFVERAVEQALGATVAPATAATVAATSAFRPAPKPGKK